MNQEKYIGMDVHTATISVAVMNAQGKLLMECVLAGWTESTFTTSPVTAPFTVALEPAN